MKEFWKSVRNNGYFLHLTLVTPGGGRCPVGFSERIFSLLYRILRGAETEHKGNFMLYGCKLSDCGSELLGGSCFQLQKGSGLSGKTDRCFAA